MARIDVRKLADSPDWLFEVTVTEPTGQTVHQVTVPEDEYVRLTERASSPERLVRRSFEFLLERESKESILRLFEISVISRYFPDYESEMRSHTPE